MEHHRHRAEDKAWSDITDIEPREKLDAGAATLRTLCLDGAVKLARSLWWAWLAMRLCCKAHERPALFVGPCPDLLRSDVIA